MGTRGHKGQDYSGLKGRAHFFRNTGKIESCKVPLKVPLQTRSALHIATEFKKFCGVQEIASCLRQSFEDVFENHMRHVGFACSLGFGVSCAFTFASHSPMKILC